MHAHSLANKVVWLTGAKRIGQQVARAVAEEGAQLIISYRSSRTEAETVARDVAGLGSEARLIQCDTSSRESVTLAVEEMKKSKTRRAGAHGVNFLSHRAGSNHRSLL